MQASPLFNIMKFHRLRNLFISDQKYLEKKYLKRMGFKPDLTNPRRFTELINWKKLHDKDPLYVRCADKFAVREFIARNTDPQILVPLLAHGRKWSDIKFEELPAPYIIKTTHGSGQNVVIENWNSSLEQSLEKYFSDALMTNYYSDLREWQYKDIPPALIVEKLLGEVGTLPPDYKIHCFNYGPDVEMIVEITGGRPNETWAAFHDSDWNRLDIEFTYPDSKKDVTPPKNLELMLSTATQLSSGFHYVRVDLYEVEGKLFFGELTFSPNSGFVKFKPDDWDYAFGEKMLATGILNKKPNRNHAPL
jgi:hypothetical protein